MDFAEEVRLLLRVITHPSGFGIDLFGVMEVRGTEDPNIWEVWQDPQTPQARVASFKTPLAAVEFFCLMRRRRELGLEFESESKKPSCDVSGMVNPHRTGPWIADLSADRRSCTLLGYACVADFDLSEDALVPLSWEILGKVEELEPAIKRGDCDTLNIGLYQKGNDIRVWKVHTGV